MQLAAYVLTIFGKFAADLTHEWYKYLSVKKCEVELLFDIEGFYEEPVMFDHVLIVGVQ